MNLGILLDVSRYFHAKKHVISDSDRLRLAQDLASPPMPSQAEVTINNNKLEEHLLVWAASLGSEQRLARNPVLNYIYLVILGHGCVVFYHCHMSAANRA